MPLNISASMAVCNNSTLAGIAHPPCSAACLPSPWYRFDGNLSFPTQHGTTPQQLVSSFSRRDVQLVDMHAASTAASQAWPEACQLCQACAINARNEDEVGQFNSLLGQFTTAYGGVRYTDMAIKLNSQYHEHAATCSAGGLCPKQLQHLRSYHLTLTCLQAVQLAMHCSSIGIGTVAATAQNPPQGLAAAVATPSSGGSGSW